MIIIYKLINKTNGKFYVGQTCRTLDERWNRGHGYATCFYLDRAIQKYGKDNFDYEVLEYLNDGVSQKTIDEIEAFWILDLKSNDPNIGYNLMFVSGNGRHSEETKKKMSDNHADISGGNNPMFGKFHTDETKIKISNIHKGKIDSPETRERKSRMGKPSNTKEFFKINKTWKLVNGKRVWINKE